MSQTPPPYALPTWADDDNLYIQFPAKDGPVTMSFPLAHGGLTKALPYFRMFFQKTPRPVVIPSKVVPATRAAAIEVLRNLGMMI